MAFIKTRWLDTVTTDTTTDVEEVVGASIYVLQAEATGTPHNAGVSLEGSIDGVIWSHLGSVSANGPFAEIAWVNDRPVKYIRLRATMTFFTGTPPTVTASVIAL